MASPPPTSYRVVDLGPIEFAPNVDPVRARNGTFGINNHGEVAFARQKIGTAETEPRAYIWLPEAIPGLSEGFHLIPNLGGIPSNPPSIARDISDDRFVVGQDRGKADGDVGSEAFSYGPLDNMPSVRTYSRTGSTWMAGHAVTEGSQPWMCGHTDIVICTNAQSGDQRTTRGFFLEVLAASPTPTLLDPLLDMDEDDTTRAFDLVPEVSQTAGTLPVRVAGESTSDWLLPQCTTDPAKLCLTDEDVVVWGELGSASAAELPPVGNASDPDELGSHGRAINSDKTVVGWAYRDSPCGNTFAALWEDSGGGYTVRTDLPGLGVDGYGHALGLNDLDPPTVVGFDPFNLHAARWHYDGTAWNVVDLQDTIEASCFDSLEQAMDVNDHGWIVGWGLNSGERHAFVLIPIDDDACASDFDGDGDVDTDDLLDLLGVWGPCEEGVICVEDIDRNCTVDTPDLLDLLTNWGTDCDGTGQIPEDVQDCFDKFGSDLIALQACLQAVTGN